VLLPRIRGWYIDEDYSNRQLLGKVCPSCNAQSFVTELKHVFKNPLTIEAIESWAREHGEEHYDGKIPYLFFPTKKNLGTWKNYIGKYIALQSLKIIRFVENYHNTIISQLVQFFPASERISYETYLEAWTHPLIQDKLGKQRGMAHFSYRREGLI